MCLHTFCLIREPSCFGRLLVEQTTEVTVDKETTQNPGGTTSFSLKPAIVQRYCLTAEYRSAFLGQLRNMVQASNSGTQHTELQSSRIKKDEHSVSSIVDLIQGGVELTDKLEELTCLLYCNSTVITKDNELRYQLFCSRRGEIKNTSFLHAKIVL